MSATQPHGPCGARPTHSWVTPKVGENQAVCALCSYSVALSDIMVTTVRKLADKAFEDAVADYWKRMSS